MRTRMQPGGGSDGAYTLDAESIFVIVLVGQLELDVDGERLTLDIRTPAPAGLTHPTQQRHHHRRGPT